MEYLSEIISGLTLLGITIVGLRQNIVIKNYKDYIDAMDVSKIKDFSEIAVEREAIKHDVEKLKIEEAIKLYEKEYIKPVVNLANIGLDICRLLAIYQDSDSQKIPVIPEILFSEIYPNEDNSQIFD